MAQIDVIIFQSYLFSRCDASVKIWHTTYRYLALRICFYLPRVVCKQFKFQSMIAAYCCNCMLTIYSKRQKTDFTISGTSFVPVKFSRLNFVFIQQESHIGMNQIIQITCRPNLFTLRSKKEQENEN